MASKDIRCIVKCVISFQDGNCYPPEIKKVEMVVGDGRMLPRGTLCSYSYMDNGKWRLFIYDLDKEKFFEYPGDDGHGGSSFKKKAVE